MKLAAYVGVSTDKQAEQGLGLDVRRAGIRRWAKANGHRIVAWFADEGVSGSNGVDARTGLLDALAAIADGKARGLVVFKLDRLARSLTVQEATLSKLWAMEAAVFSVDLVRFRRTTLTTRCELRFGRWWASSPSLSGA